VYVLLLEIQELEFVFYASRSCLMNAYEEKMQAWQKVMAAYHQRMPLKVISGLTASTPGSAQSPMLSNK